MITDDDAAESLSLMMEQERTTYSCVDYLHADSTRVNHNNEYCRRHRRGNRERITPDDRMKIVDWCYEIVDQCQLDRDTVAVAMNIVDRFMSSQERARDMLFDRHQYQLLTITSLYISIKLHEHTSFSSDDFSAASRQVYSTQEIEAMELKILHGLDWRICVPTPLRVGCQILELLESSVTTDQEVSRGTWDFLNEELAYQTENALREYYFSTQHSSTIAIVAIMNAIEQVKDSDYEILMGGLVQIIKSFDFDCPQDLLRAKERLRILMEENEESGEDSIYDTLPEDVRRVLRESQQCKVAGPEVNSDTMMNTKSFNSPRSSVALNGEEEDDDDSSCVTVC